MYVNERSSYLIGITFLLAANLGGPINETIAVRENSYGLFRLTVNSGKRIIAATG